MCTLLLIFYSGLCASLSLSLYDTYLYVVWFCLPAGLMYYNSCNSALEGRQMNMLSVYLWLDHASARTTLNKSEQRRRRLCTCPLLLLVDCQCIPLHRRQHCTYGHDRGAHDPCAREICSADPSLLEGL